MDWTQKTNEMMKTWTDAQQQLWSGWMGMMPGMAGAGRGFPAFPGFDPSQFIKMGIDTWSGGSEGAAQRLAGNIFGTPDVMMQSINLLMNAWQSVVPNLEAGKAWQPDLQGLLQKWQQDMMSLTGQQSGMGGDFAELTKSVFGQWAPMTGPWLAMVGQAMGAGHPGAAFMGGTSGLNRILGFEEGAHPMPALGEMPRGTVVREKMGKALKAIDSFNDLKKAEAEFQAAMAKGMAKAVERTMEHLAKLAEKGEKITSIRDLMRTWFGVADKTLNEVFTSPDFIATQDKMTVALMNHKIKKREAMELVYRELDLPTRSGVDEAYRDLHSLKKEVRMLRRQVNELANQGGSAGAGEPAKAAAKKPAAAAAKKTQD